jgi:hypothetical protein
MQDETALLVEVRAAGVKGRGVFALRDFVRGQVVVIGKPLARAQERTWETLQMGIDHHIKIDEPFERINHSCDPNCGIQANQWGGYNLVAMRPIVPGEEIVYDYCMSEWVSIAIPGECQCGTSLCSGAVRGGQFLSQHALARYAGFLAPYYEVLLGNRYFGLTGDGQ